ncbi:MAG: thioredoxin [Erysipelotrichaceae bacterium]|nr:thioredoxin [Erysipelotrichaceae bacterium]
MKIVDREEFNELKKEGNLVVDFYADWCGPCKMLGPVMETVAEDYPEVTFVKVNVDEEPELAESYGIMSIPSVFFLKDGEIVKQFLGLQQERNIREMLDEAYK